MKRGNAHKGLMFGANRAMRLAAWESEPDHAADVHLFRLQRVYLPNQRTWIVRRAGINPCRRTRQLPRRGGRVVNFVAATGHIYGIHDRVPVLFADTVGTSASKRI
jgi:hypothetical protein